MKYIYIFICSILLCVTNLYGQTTHKGNKTVYKGTFIGWNVVPTIQTLLNEGNQSAEFSTEINLQHRYFPIVEFGFDNKELTTLSYQYQSSGIFGRLGVNYNFVKPSKLFPDNSFYFGLRYALASSEHQLTTSISENYWQETGNVAINPTHVISAWIESVVGVKAALNKSFYLGASVRYAFSPHYYTLSLVVPTYIPGYGEISSNKWIFAYSIIYKLPF